MSEPTERQGDAATPPLLVVDDAASIRVMVRVAMEAMGLRVEEAASGDAALTMLDDLRPELILLDVSMPGTDGIEVCRLLRSREVFERLPIIMMTGHDDGDSIARAHQAGATDFIVKPLNLELLKHRVRYAIRASKDSRALANAQRAATHLALHDTLTGLPNRRHFDQSLSQAMADARRTDRCVGVLYFDLDGFKRVNDNFGHDVGDQVLETVAARVRRCLRITDGVSRVGVGEKSSVSRLGGDEFTVLVEDIGHRRDLVEIVRRVQTVVAQPIHISEAQTVQLTPSIGISVYPHDGDTVEALLKNADLAMYHAKREGWNNVQFFTEHLNADHLDRLQVEAALVRALEREEFDLHYQPIFDLATGGLDAMEALIRWQSPKLGRVPPGRFVRVAEEIGLMVPIGEWVVRSACAQSRAWRDQGHGEICVAVNLSGAQVRHPRLVKTVREILEEHALCPGSLQIEMTEGVLMDHMEFEGGALDELRDYGVRLALDDFGTGYSSLSCLHRLKPDIVKIDGSFIRDIDTDEDGRCIVSALLMMARTLGLRVVAEGVEHRSQLDYLRGQGCHAAQGFLLGRPRPASAQLRAELGDWDAGRGRPKQGVVAA